MPGQTVAEPVAKDELGRQRFAEMIARHAALPLGEQEAAFRAELRSYQGDLPQRDDITVLGFGGRRMS